MSVSSSNDGSRRSPLGAHEPRVSCVTCKKRKVRCDKRYPCANCARKSIDCIYVTTEKRRTRGPGKHRSGERMEHMTSRVAQLEQVLEKLKSRTHGEEPLVEKESPQVTPDSASINTSTKTESVQVADVEEGISVDRSAARLLVTGGKSRYIRNKFWATMNDALDGSEDLPVDTTASQSHFPQPTPAISASHNLLFGSLGGSVDLEMLRPPAFQIPLYWQLYTKNIDPIYKFLHKPSMEKIITMASNSEALSPSTEALLFGIYFVVIVSMSTSKVQVTFQDNKDRLLSRYRCGLERALGLAGLLNTQEISTLQAFILLIICIRRDDDTRTVWTLVGLAVRLAVGMGLQHDGAKFKLNPLETELRRRLWWQIYLLDIRAAEDQGCEVTIAENSFDTQLPLNINDSDLNANALELPPPRTGLTEMTTTVMRLDVVETGRKIRTVDSATFSLGDQNLSLREKLEAIKSCERKLHHRYLQYCRPEVPINVFMYTLAKHCIAKMSLLAHQPDYRIRSNDQVPSTPTKPELSRDELFVMSISILEGCQFLENTPELEPWAWMSRKYVQWHPLAYVLTELNSSSRQPGALVDRAWRVIDSLYADSTTTERSSDRSNESIIVPVKKLLLGARRKREQAPNPPEAQNVRRSAELDQWNLQQFQDVGSTTENFDWFLGAPEGDPAILAADLGREQQRVTPLSLPIQDVEFWNDMTGLLQYQPFVNSGAIGGGDMSDWW